MADSLQQTPEPILERSSNLTRLSSVPGCPACINCTAYGSSGSRCAALRMAAAWAAPGIGTATPAAASIPRVKPTAIRGRRNCCRNGTGRNITLVSRRTNNTSIMSQTSSTCAKTSNSMRGSPRRSTTRRRIAGTSSWRVASVPGRNFSSRRSASCPLGTHRRLRGSRASRASRFTPRAGRRKKWTSPASA